MGLGGRPRRRRDRGRRPRVRQRDLAVRRARGAPLALRSGWSARKRCSAGTPIWLFGAREVLRWHADLAVRRAGGAPLARRSFLGGVPPAVRPWRTGPGRVEKVEVLGQ